MTPVLKELFTRGKGHIQKKLPEVLGVKIGEGRERERVLSHAGCRTRFWHLNADFMALTFKKSHSIVKAQMGKNLPAMQNPGFNPWFRKIPWRREWQPTPVFLPRGFHRQRSLAGYRPWVHKELDMTEWLTVSLSLFPLPIIDWYPVSDRVGHF